MCSNGDDIVHLVLTDTGSTADTPSSVSCQVTITGNARCLTLLRLILPLGALLAFDNGQTEGARFTVRCTEIGTENSETAASAASSQGAWRIAIHSLTSD